MDVIPLLNVADISAFLKLKSETIYMLITREGLPASKVGGQWRFDIEEVTAWFKQQRQPQSVHRSN